MRRKTEEQIKGEKTAGDSHRQTSEKTALRKNENSLKKAMRKEGNVLKD